MEDAEPDVWVRGRGEPEVAVVGSMHGDEPSGARAIHRLLERDVEYDRAVKYVVANPPALERGVRYVDVDMNRVFPGDVDSGDLERRLAARVCMETQGYTTLALHSTQSTPKPFALFSRHDTDVLRWASRLPVEHAVDESRISDGSFTGCGDVVSVECGCQGTPAATDTAVEVVEAFLQVTGAADTGYVSEGEPDYYEVYDRVGKDPDVDYSLRVDNFTEVGEGTVYATHSVGELKAEESFYPVLMSEEGYEDVLGYKARRVAGSLEEAMEHFK